MSLSSCLEKEDGAEQREGRTTPHHTTGVKLAWRSAAWGERGPECEGSRLRRESKRTGRLHSAELPEVGGLWGCLLPLGKQLPEPSFKLQ